MKTLIDFRGVRPDMLALCERNRKYFQEFPSSLLSVNSDAKTSKGTDEGILTGVMYLAPADLSGENLCPFAERAGCKNVCLE